MNMNFKIVIAVALMGVILTGGCGRRRQVTTTDPIAPIEFIAVDQSISSDAADDKNDAADVEVEVIQSSPIRVKDDKPILTTQSTSQSVRRPKDVIDAAVLVVNAEHITADDVIRRIRPDLEATASTYNEDVYLRRAEGLIGQAARDLISESLLYSQVCERIPDEQQPAIDKVVDQEIIRIANQRAGGSMVRLESGLKSQGSTLEILRDQVRRQIVTQQYLRETIKPKVVVTRREMWQYYQEHQDEFCQVGRACVFLIEVDAEKFLDNGVSWPMASGEQKEVALSAADVKISEAFAKLKAGGDFGEIAGEYSTAANARLGGKVGWISRGSYRLKEIEDQAFSAKVGEIAGPITIGSKLFLVKVSDRQEGKTVSFADSQAAVKLQMEQSLYRRLVMEYLAKIWRRSQVGELEPFLEAVHARLPAYEIMRQKALGQSKTSK